MIDAMAERYGVLPTDIMDRATTFDLFVFDRVVGYKNAEMLKEQGKPNPQQVKEESLLAAIERVKQRNGKSDQ